MKFWGGIAAFFALLLDKWSTVIMALRGQKHKSKVKDHERADEIRDRVDRNLDDELHKHDDAGWRD